MKRIKLFFCLIAFIAFAHSASAVEEPYVNELKGAQVATGGFFTVSDEKFNNSSSWSLINQNISVNNIITFEINYDTSIYFYNTPFNCTINFKIYIYGNQSDTSQVTDSTTYSSVSLKVIYDTVTGNPYKGIALYKFNGVYKYKVKILGITSPQLSPIPAIFRLKGQIIVDRKYNFSDNTSDITRWSVLNSNQLKLEWTPSNYPGAEMFDLEYTHIDSSSLIAVSIRSYESGGAYFVPADSLEKWFQNNSTRITTASSNYLLNVAYDSGYILFRIRGVQIHYPDDVRWEGNWNYSARPAATSCTTCPTGVVFFAGHEVLLNWQFSISFAEEGKRKEVRSYFDGSLRNRQSITINNSDNKTIVQETIYDVLGRPVVNILPVPANDSTIHYFRGFNKNHNGDPYSFSDITYGSGCTTTADSLTAFSGAGKYYSPQNAFINNFYYAKYIPDAAGYPFTVTEYVSDNTGRIKSQGGVGPAFQLGSNHETSYFYGKPAQIELDRLFGNEAGDASHYLKNMVVDPNGQISVSYIDASGKTIATALAGAVPGNLHPLPSSDGASVNVSNDLILPGDFARNSSDYSLTASSTFLAPVTGTYSFKYKIDPLVYRKNFGPDKDSTICSTCYYDLEVVVKDNCENIIGRDTVSAGNVFDTTCVTPGAIADSFDVNIDKIGEYYITYSLKVSRDALNFFDSTHLVKNSDIKKLNFFLLEELKQTDFYGCYSNCETCLDKLGTQNEFFINFKSLYLNDSVAFGIEDSLWVLSLYDSLLNHCQSIQSECAMNVCDEKLLLLKMDVTPGGQYALYDSAYNLLETPINVLAHRNQISFFTDGFGNRDSVTLVNQEGEDSTRVDVKDLNDSLFIIHWKDSWADSLVRLHPEYCYYLWCIANSDSYEFDKEIENWADADTAMARGWFDPDNYHALLDEDPFFNGTGRGVALYNKMKDSLRLFSRRHVRFSNKDKNILQFIDVVLYCKTQYNGWNDCHPDSACRSRNREWFLYKELYLNLKQRFYEEARRTSTDSVFVNCTNCRIGKDLLELSGFDCISPPIDDFIMVPCEPPFLEEMGCKQIQYIGANPIQNKLIVTYRNVKSGFIHCPECPLYTYTNIIFYPGQTTYTINYSILSRIPVDIVNVRCYSDSLYIPFTDSLCNYYCPDGIYDPYDRDSISFYIHHGTPLSPPDSVPSGYDGCQFYPSFDLQTGSNSTCKFFNVWVCIYDSTCPGGGICHGGPSYPSHCPATGNDTLYRNKIRRYPEYVNTDDLLNNILHNPQQSSQQIEQQSVSECHATCEAQADIWINILKRCSTDSVKMAQLKDVLIDICSKGCSSNNPYGASSIPSTVGAAYHSFEEAIEGILGPGAINDSCTSELLSQPYPYNKQPVYVERVIVETNYDICHKIDQYKSAWQSLGSGSGSFHHYLQVNLGNKYSLDSTELDDLLNSCTNCNGVLKNDIALPIAFEPNAPPCLTCDSVQAALTAFNNKFPDIDSTNDDYEQLFANFFNHRFGYALTYTHYKNFLDSCSAHPSSGIKLCNEPMQQEDTADDNSCTRELFTTALTNAYNTYIAYIDSVRRDFRNAYLTKCLNVQPKLTMTADLYEYHYTLYYYDQSGSLVKTIPPEGVHLLDNTDIQYVQNFRLLKNEGCYQYSDSIKFNNDGKIRWDVNQFESQPFTVEMMADLTSHADQVIASKVSDYHYLISGIPSVRDAGFVLEIDSNKLQVDLYGIKIINSQRKAEAVSVLNVSNLIPLNQWTHLAVQRTNDLNDPIRVFINGQQIAMQYVSNNISDADVFSGDTALIAASHNSTNIPLAGKLRGTLKNLRIYNRLLSADELRQNSFDACQLPADKTGLLFWSALNDATGNVVPEYINRLSGNLTGFTWSAATGVFPGHGLPTTYQYNSLNQVLQQYSPDGDTTTFYYDRLGRLIVSQNKEQKENSSYSGSANRYSYTKYDELGRIKEVGEKSGASPSNITSVNLLDTTEVKNWIASGINRQLTKTIYDNPVNSYQSTGTSRKRVVASVYLENASDSEGDSTLYAYDILGNVKILVQHIKALVAADATNGKKRVDYDYDLVSGKVNMVSYQAGKGDQFFYKYQYDADNRVTRSYSSRDQLIWIEDASYNYYLHGPLARTELGHYKVQGIDYAYTLQGWLKGINSDTINPSYDMAQDGYHGSIYERVSRDVYAFKLGYYTNDYAQINSAVTPFQLAYSPPGSLDATGNQLFNGNISYTSLALSKINSANTAGYSYGYDQLNRLVEMRQHQTASTWSNSNIITAYRESISYDANGNILKYLRKGNATTVDMDSLNYKYNRDGSGNLINNRLNHVRDQVSSSNYSVDIDNQSPGNYVYDFIGNLKKDVAEGIDTIHWTVYGKIKKIDKGSGSDLVFGYDAAGNRTTKKVSGGADTTTFYVRDAQGNVLAIYSKKGAGSLLWNEQDLYGSSRLGMWRPEMQIPSSPPVVTGSAIQDSLMIGSKTYELTNHLGNVLSTISDKKIGHDSSGVVNYYFAEVLSQTDYYPFGMEMPGRSYTATSSYRYGFNGKENDNEVKGEGNQQDYGMRTYDPRVGRFLCVDPISKKYPDLTPYQFASNTPIQGVDLDGREVFYAADGALLGKIGKDPAIRIVTPEYLKKITNILTRDHMTIAQGFNNINSGKANDVKGATKDWMDNSRETYSSVDDAAADFSLMNGSISIVKNEERAARIGSVQLKIKNEPGKETNQTVFILGSTVFGGSDDADINSSNLFGGKLVAGVHTHGRDPRIAGVHADNFSGSALTESLGLKGDMDWANHNGVPLYLSNPRGELKVFSPKSPYEAGDENGKLVRSDMPYDIYRQAHPSVNPRRPAYNPNIVYDDHREPTEAEAISYKLPKK